MVRQQGQGTRLNASLSAPPSGPLSFSTAEDAAEFAEQEEPAAAALAEPGAAEPEEPDAEEPGDPKKEEPAEFAVATGRIS